MSIPIQESSIVHCPHCGNEQTEKMPTNACVIIYTCPQCRQVLRPLAGDCCIFCSYGSVPCPPKQMEEQASDVIQ